MILKEKIPLEKRLEQIKAGYASTPEYNPCIIRKMAETPMKTYLSGFEEEQARMPILLGYTPKEWEKVTYGQAAARAAEIHPGDAGGCVRLEEALRILSAPLIHNFKMRQERRPRADG